MDTFTLHIAPELWRFGLPALAIGALTGGLLAWLILRGRLRDSEAELDRVMTSLRHQDALREEREQALKVAAGQLSGSFATLANQSLRANSETFLRLAEQNLGVFQERARRELGDREQAIESLIRPIQESLTESRQQIAELEKARSEAYGNIRAQLDAMRESQSLLTRETQNLVNALRRPEVRGRWGEITLRRLVELAGMIEHCDFLEQVHTRGDDQAIRPDMVIRMPDQRELVVDVKTPLDAYLESVEAGSDAERGAALDRHARNVSDHIRKLAGKAYWNQFEDSPEFVILFIPGDQFLSAALDRRPELLEDALSRQIILATPTSFVALLKAVAYGWRQLALAENAAEIRTLAEDLYNRLAVFAGHLNKVGRQLGASVDSYNRAVGSLERKVLPGAKKFVDLGVQPRRPMEAPTSIEAVTRSVDPPGKPGANDAWDEADRDEINDPFNGTRAT